MKNLKGTCKRKHKGDIFWENLLKIPLESFMIIFSTGEEERLNGGFLYDFEKDFYAVMHVYFYGVMLHLDEICYAFHDAMICNTRLLMQNVDAWLGFGYIQLCMAGCILEIENIGYQ